MMPASSGDHDRKVILLLCGVSAAQRRVVRSEQPTECPRPRRARTGRRRRHSGAPCRWRPVAVSGLNIKLVIEDWRLRPTVLLLVVALISFLRKS